MLMEQKRHRWSLEGSTVRSESTFNAIAQKVTLTKQNNKMKWDRPTNKHYNIKQIEPTHGAKAITWSSTLKKINQKFKDLVGDDAASMDVVANKL